MIRYDPGAFLDGDPPCLFCGDPEVAYVGGVLINGPEGKSYYPYHLCPDCLELPGAMAMARAVLSKIVRRRATTQLDDAMEEEMETGPC